MENAPQLLLEDLLFPILEMRTNPQHDVQGDRAGTQLQYGQQMQKLEGSANRYGLMVSVRTDNEASKNPPYAFLVESYAILVVNNPGTDEEVQKLVQENGLSMVLGAVRERIAELTARAPWGRFLINTVSLPEKRTIEYI